MSPLADLLDAHAAGLLQRLRDGLAPGGKTAPQLLDHIPDLLCELGSVLHQGRSAAVRRVAQEFAHRHYRRSFDLDALVREYGLVRDCILDFVEHTGTAVSLSELRILTDFIAHAIAAAVHKYCQLPHPELRLAGEPARAAAEIPGEPLQSRQRSELLAAHLRHSEEQLHAVIAASGAGMWSFDPVSGDIAADVRLRTLMGLPADDVLTMDSALAQIWEEDRERVRQAVVEALDGHHGGHYHVEFRINSSGTRWVESRGMAAFDAQGKATRLAGAMLDISDRKQAEVEREKLLREVQAAQLRLQGWSRVRRCSWRPCVGPRTSSRWSTVSTTA